jgi:hypothetical protein
MRNSFRSISIAALLSTTFLVASSLSIVEAQWSRSARADSSLFVCPGFYPGILTFDDGSSFIFGALQSYVFAGKLDESGVRLWPPVQIVHNDSSYIIPSDYGTNWGGWASDGAGGAIVFWYDHRGAFDTGTEWANNAIYAQRVDRNGQVCWESDGVKVNGPETGLKQGGIVNDGLGGCFIAWNESEFGFPGARNIERARVVRLSSDGSVLWEAIVDSAATRYSMSYGRPIRALDRVFIPSRNVTHAYSLNGVPITERFLGRSNILVSENDSVLYNLVSVLPQKIQQKLTATVDTVW